MTAEASARGRSNRRRGANAERLVVVYLHSQGWPDARRYLSGDGKQPGDLDWHPCIVAEVKDCAESRWPSWQRQAIAQCKEGQAPVVVRRTRGNPDPGRWTCRIHARSWLTIVRQAEFDDEDLAGDEWWSYSFAMAVADVRNMDRRAARR